MRNRKFSEKIPSWTIFGEIEIRCFTKIEMVRDSVTDSIFPNLNFLSKIEIFSHTFFQRPIFFCQKSIFLVKYLTRTMYVIHPNKQGSFR